MKESINTRPTKKDAASALGLPIGIVTVWIISMFVVVPLEVATAIGSISSFVVAYFIKERI